MPADDTSGSGDAWEAATDDVSAGAPKRSGEGSGEAEPGPDAGTTAATGGSSEQFAEDTTAEPAGRPSGEQGTATRGSAEQTTAEKGAAGQPAAEEGVGEKVAAEKQAGENGAGEKGADEKGAGEKAAGGAAEEGTAAPEEYTDARQVLDAVAAGRLAPEDAASLLDKLQTETGAGKPSQSTQAGATEGQAARDRQVDVHTKPTRLRIRAVGRRVKIVGEPFVSTVAVDGPHVIRQEGDTLQITSEGEFGASLDGFTLTPPRSLRDVQQKVMDLGRELSVRVNPALAIEAEVTAGSVNAERAPLLEQVRVTAGSARVRDVEGPIDVLVQAGSAQVEGRIGKGRSRLRVESGSLQLRLLQGSSVRIRPDTQLGRVQWEPPRPGKESEERVIGVGDARLDLEVVMGAATVKEAP